MEASRQRRRRFLVRTGAGALALSWAAAARALDTPVGKVILTITGRLTEPNIEGGAAFDLALLRRLPMHSFTTTTPWYPRPRKFSGVLVRDLLTTVGARATTLKAVALNDYRVDIPIDDLMQHGALLAYLLDDNPMPVRDKGPLVIIYPFDDKPELRSAVHYSRAIWQLRSLELR